MAQQTAVDLLWDSLTCLFFLQDGMPEQAMDAYKNAKQMEKEQHYNTWDESRLAEGWKTFQKYYNETYGTE
jgi:hypothetical protein